MHTHKQTNDLHLISRIVYIFVLEPLLMREMNGSC